MEGSLKLRGANTETPYARLLIKSLMRPAKQQDRCTRSSAFSPCFLV